jgi:hypothetical protein
MSTDHEQSPRKLVYLRDHAPRPRVRATRQERKPVVAHPELASEAAWLGRLLMATAAVMVVHALLVLTGATAEGDAAADWSASRLFANGYVVTTAGFAARHLLRGTPRTSLAVAFAASALIVVAIEGLAHLLITTDLSRISLAARTDILTRTGMLGLGVWAASFALRVDRRSTPVT